MEKRQMESTKKEQRAYFKACRDRLSTQEVMEKSYQIQERCIASLKQKEIKLALLYAPLGQEVKTLEIAKWFWQQHIVTAYPKVVGETMEFYEVTDLSQLKEGTFHVMEPVVTQCRRADIFDEESTVVITPGVVFDRQGGRIGYGKGFYDRFFRQYPQLTKIGLAYECQMAEQAVLEAHDIGLDEVVTEEALYDCTKS
jgi:5-formyltetrahydrofolate cyclo-ligase